mgnify:CR=1 FL=1
MKTMTFIMLGFLLAALSVHAQDRDGKEIDKSEYTEVHDVPPQLEGGFAELRKHLEYPPSAAKEGVQGTVVLRVYVASSGKVDAIEVEKSPHDELSQAAIDAVEQVGFTPARIGGKAVKSVVYVPVKFRLK